MPDLEQSQSRPEAATPSPVRKVVPVLLGLALLGWWMWSPQGESAEDLASKKLANGRAKVEAGQYSEGIELLAEVADSGTSHAEAAGENLSKWVSPGGMTLMPKAQAAAVLEMAIDGVQFGRPLAIPSIVVQSALGLAEKHGVEDAKFAAKIVTEVAPLVEEAEAEAFGTKRREILQAALAKHPQDIDVVSSFAMMLETERKAEECKEFLTPLTEKLADSEGARILGLLRAQDGDLGAARTLLGDYCALRLQEFSAANAELADLWRSISESALESLNRGSQTDDRYARYKTADAANQERMVSQAVEAAVRGDPAFRREQKRAARQGPIVPVALTLGVVMLRRAQEMPAALRKAELEEAEKVFLAIQSSAGQTSQFRLSYGQILYWLGKSEEGRRLFDEFLTEAGRTPEPLIVVSGALRSVGADSEARTLAEEAFEVATDVEKKHEAAAMRALLQRDLEDRILWLERSDPEDKNIRASLATARGRQAARLGNDEEAKKSYRQAADLYASFRKSSTSLNNAALTYQALFEVSGRAEDLRKASAMLQEAHTLTPGESIILGNAASTLTATLVLKLLDGVVDWQVVREPPDLGMLTHLYNDQAGRTAMQKRIDDAEEYQRAVSQTQQCALLSPKNPRPYSMLLGLHLAVRNQSALELLRDSIEHAQIDLTDYEEAARSFYAGENEERDRAEAKHAADRAARSLSKFEKPSVAFAIAIDKALSHASQARLLGAEPSPDPLIEHAERVYTALPSEGLRSSLIGALLRRASTVLAAERTAFAQVLERCRRSLTPDYILLLESQRDEELREVAAGNADVRRAVALVEEGFLLTPRSANSWRWAILRQFKPSAAKALGEAAKSDSVRRFRYGIQRALQPLDASIAIDSYWQHVLSGEKELAAQLVKGLQERDVPIPAMK